MVPKMLEARRDNTGAFCCCAFESSEHGFFFCRYCLQHCRCCAAPSNPGQHLACAHPRAHRMPRCPHPLLLTHLRARSLRQALEDGLDEHVPGAAVLLLLRHMCASLAFALPASASAFATPAPCHMWPAPRRGATCGRAPCSPTSTTSPSPTCAQSAATARAGSCASRACTATCRGTSAATACAPAAGDAESRARPSAACASRWVGVGGRAPLMLGGAACAPTRLCTPH